MKDRIVIDIGQLMDEIFEAYVLGRVHSARAASPPHKVVETAI